VSAFLSPRPHQYLIVKEQLTEAQHRDNFARIEREEFLGLSVELFDDDPALHDLGFLRHYVGIRALSLRSPRASSIEPIASVAPHLESLKVGEFFSKAVSIEPIAQCEKLQSLALVRASKGIDAVGTLTGLRRLSLTGQRGVDRATYLRPLVNLEDLYVGFSSLESSAFLAQLPKLRSLEMLRVKTLPELDGVLALGALESVLLDAVSQLRQLPRLEPLRALRMMVLITLSALTDVTGLAGSTVEELGLVSLGLTAENLEVLQTMPHLARAVVELKSKKETEAVNRALGTRAKETLMDLPRYGWFAIR